MATAIIAITAHCAKLQSFHIPFSFTMHLQKLIDTQIFMFQYYIRIKILLHILDILLKLRFGLETLTKRTNGIQVQT